jgi:alpha-mannosidase
MRFNDLVILLPCQSLEDFSLDRDAADAEQLLSAYSALWHPALMASAQTMPRWVRAEDPPQEPAGHLVMLPGSSEGRLPADWLGRAEVAGACVIRGLQHRDEMVAAALERLDGGAGGVEPRLAGDFLALGFCHLMVELLTRQLRYMSNLDEVRFRREAVGAAEAALKGDAEAARDQLRNAFDQLTEAREYFYPVEAYLIDLTLVASTTLGRPLRDELAAGRPTSLLVSAADVERMAAEEPETLSALREALEKGTASLVGGGLDDQPLPLMPIEALLEHFQWGLAAYQQHLGRRPETFGRRRFGLSPVLPQLLERLGFRAALHFTLDDGRFPSGNQSKIRWEGVDGSVLDGLARLPLEITRSDNFLRLPEKLGSTLDLDHTATAVMAHWPGQTCPWYEDLKRMVEYSPVLGKFVTVDEYSTQTSLAGQQKRYTVDEYRSPYLRQEVAAGRSDPISRWVRYYGRRARLDALRTVQCLADLLAGATADSPDQDPFRRATDQALASETASDAPKNTGLDEQIGRALDEAVRGFAKRLPRNGHAMERTGLLVLNPWSVARRSWVEAAGLGGLPTVGAPVRAVAPLDRGCQVAVDVPAMGFAWVDPGAGQPAPPRPRRRWLQNLWSRKKPQQPPMAAKLLVRDQPVYVLRNEHFEARINPATGAIRALHDYYSRGIRLAQQLALRMPDPSLRDEGLEEGPDTDYSVMAADEVKVTCSGPIVGEVVSRGRLMDRQGHRLAGFVQTSRVRRGSRVLELEVQLDVDRQPGPDPWDSYYAVRFAWGDMTADMVRSVNQASRPTDAKLLEAPHYIDLRVDKVRTTILTGGLPYHRRFGLRKLDTLLAVRGETARSFRLGVGIDLTHPAPAAMDFMAPRTAVVERACPPTTSTGWLFHVDARNVIATAWMPLASEGRVEGFYVRLLETEGRRAETVLRCFRAVQSARRVDFAQQPPVELPVQDDRVKLELGPHQFVGIEARFA